MRLRRWKVHKLGFKDFSGIDYINRKLPVPVDLEPGPYRFDPPVRTSSRIKTLEGEERPFRRSLEIGYND